MKTKLLALIAMLLATALQAQYFTKQYTMTGSSSDQGMKGINVISIGGNINYLQTGSTVEAGVRKPMLTRTLASGAQAFCRSYTLPTSAGPINATGIAVTYDPTTNLIIMVGNFIENATLAEGVFCMQINNTGNVVPGSLQYFYNPLQGKKLYVSAVKMSTTTSTFVACGSAETSVAGSYDPWVWRFNLSYVGWMRIYNETNHNASWNTIATDLVESTFLGVGEIAVVGQTTQGAPVYRGFLLRVTTGGAFTTMRAYNSGVTNADDRFTCITRCNATNSIGNGYVIGGYTNTSNGALSNFVNAWVIRMNNAGTTIDWSNTYAYTSASSCYMSGIVERYSTANAAYEYYVAGNVLTGQIGNRDMVVMKIKQDGTTGPSSQFTYGKSWTDESAISIDQGNGSTYPGIVVFGHRKLPGNLYDFFMVKAYYNGVAHNTTVPPTILDSCDQNILETSPIPMPPPMVTFVATNTSVTPKAMSTPSFIEGSDWILCNAASIPNGDNTRHASGESQFNAFGLMAYPNPVESGSQLMVQLQLADYAQVQLILTDQLGRTVWTGSQNGTPGATSLSISLHALPAGLYNLTAICNNEVKNQLISIQ